MMRYTTILLITLYIAFSPACFMFSTHSAHAQAHCIGSTNTATHSDMHGVSGESDFSEVAFTNIAGHADMYAAATSAHIDGALLLPLVAAIFVLLVPIVAGIASTDSAKFRTARSFHEMRAMRVSLSRRISELRYLASTIASPNPSYALA
jgi:hypothetical protein